MADTDMVNYKVVMLGDSGVGKTCIVNRYIKETFDPFEDSPTIGSNYCGKVETVKPANVPQAVRVKLQIWDTAGSEQFRSLTPIYYKNANAVCLVYDSTNMKSFEELAFWVDELKEQASEKIIIALVASKIDDIEHEAVSIKKATEYAKQIKATFYQTSSKTG